jgi:diguanylate cyclase (GGDEF)-like protein
MSIEDQQIPTFRTHADHEILINEGLRQALAVSSPSKSLDILLGYLGRELRGDRVYIFEEDQGKGYSNTYEWCADGVVPQKDNLQQVSPEIASIWLEQFRNKENVIIKQLDDIRETDPRMYDLLKPQDIHSLVASSLVFNNRIIGFYGIDNPPAELMENISVLFQIMGYFIVSLMRRRILQDRLEKLSFYDPLTGCRNRHAMNDFMETIEKNTSVGLLYGDVIGLKRVNDAKGHQAGDELLVRAADSMRQVFSKDDLYRIGGDEFLVMCTGVTEEELLSKENQLKQALREHGVEMSLGRVWSLKGDLDMDDLLRRADELMYEDKRRYYAQDAARRRAGQTTTE